MDCTADEYSYQVFQSDKFASINPRRQLSYVRMERQMFDFMLFEILFVPRFHRRAMHTASIRIVTTQFGITFAFQTAICFSENDVHFVFSQFCFAGRGWFYGLKWWGKWWNWATRAACTWLRPKCFDHLREKIRIISKFNPRLGGIVCFTHRWCSNRQWFDEDHIAMFQFVVINCLWSARGQFIFVVSFTKHSEIVCIEFKCIVNGFVELTDCCRWK